MSGTITVERYEALEALLAFRESTAQYARQFEDAFASSLTMDSDPVSVNIWSNDRGHEFASKILTQAESESVVVEQEEALQNVRSKINQL